MFRKQQKHGMAEMPWGQAWLPSFCFMWLGAPPPPELGNPARGPGMERKKNQSSGLSHAQCDALEIPKYKDNVNDVI